MSSDKSSRILYIQYTNPAAYPPLQHSSHIFAEKGWQVLFLGTESQGAIAFTFPKKANITVKKMTFCSPGWRQKIHYFRFLLWTLIWTLRWKPKWVYSSDSLVCPIALLLSFLPSVEVVYHEHDSPRDDSRGVFSQFILTTRRWLSNRAEISILPNSKRVAHFNKTLNPKNEALCVWNCPNKEEPVTRRLPWKGENLWLLYHGSIVPTQLPETIIYALKKLPQNIRLRVVGYETIGHIGYVNYLKEIADQLDISDQLEFLGTFSTRSELLQQCQKSDVGLALFPTKVMQPMPGASNKPFDYLACGLPLVVSRLHDWEEMYVKPGYGVSCNPDEPESIANTLRWYMEHPVEMREMGECGRKQILEKWNYETQFSSVLDLMRCK